MQSGSWWVQWSDPSLEWFVLSVAGPFDSKEEAHAAAREDRAGRPHVYNTEDGKEARELMTAMMNG